MSCNDDKEGGPGVIRFKDWDQARQCVDSLNKAINEIASMPPERRAALAAVIQKWKLVCEATTEVAR